MALSGRSFKHLLLIPVISLIREDTLLFLLRSLQCPDLVQLLLSGGRLCGPRLAFQEVRRHVREARVAAKQRAAADASPHSAQNKAHPAHSREPKSKQLTS